MRGQIPPECRVGTDDFGGASVCHQSCGAAAHDRGHWESSHVVWRNLQGKKDWVLKPFILDGDWTFVPSGIARTHAASAPLSFETLLRDSAARLAIISRNLGEIPLN
jgi:hypothetical protein